MSLYRIRYTLQRENKERAEDGHPEVATCLNNLAQLLEARNKPAEAEQLYREALAISRSTAAAGIPVMTICFGNLFDLCEKRGDKDQAIRLLKEHLQWIRANLPKESSDLARQLAMIGVSLLYLESWDDAEPVIREALAIRTAQEPDGWSTFNTKSMLGGVLLGQKKYAEAEPLLLEGYHGLKHHAHEIPPDTKDLRISESLQRLARLYTTWHAAAPDQGYDVKAAEWQKIWDDYWVLATQESPHQ